MNTSEICSPPHTIDKRKQSRRVINDLDNVDFISSNVHSSHQEALLYIFEDNEADTKNQLADILTKGISHAMNGIIFCVCLTLAISVLQSVLK